MKKLILSVCLTLSVVLLQAQVTFSSNFEGGSIGAVELLDSARICVSPGDTVEHLSYLVNGRFDPDNPVDTTLDASASWLYFRMTGMKGKQIYLTFQDNGTHRSMYSYDNVNWSRLPFHEASRRGIDKRYDCDTMFVALYVPYTYSYLQKRLGEWSSREGTTLDTIGYSHEHRPLQMLHITDTSIADSLKARIWIHGRQHPAESPGSWFLDGLIDKLTADTPEGQSLRRQIDAYILPFTNPDGVADGLSRSNATGVNQEINFGRSIDSTCVEVRAIKAMFEKLTKERPIDVMINSHSQYADYATFWMHKGSSTSRDYLRRQWVLTGLTCSFNEYIKPTDMLFSAPAPRYPEGWFWNNSNGRTLALTIETPYTCFSRNLDGPWATNEILRSLGERAIQAVAEYLELSTPKRIIIETPENMNLSWFLINSDKNTYMGENGWVAQKKGAKVTYSLKHLTEGNYKVYRYIPGKNIEPSGRKDNLFDTDPGVHGWVFECEHIQKEDGRFKYVYYAKDKGDFADAILLIAE